MHALYLARGGNDFLIGDGALQYGPEYVWESYYSARLFPGFFTTLDVQHVANPAYNQDRGPVWIYSLQAPIEFGKGTEPDYCPKVGMFQNGTIIRLRPYFLRRLKNTLDAWPDVVTTITNKISSDTSVATEPMIR